MALDEDTEYQLEQNEIAWLAGGLYRKLLFCVGCRTDSQADAGSDTTALVIHHGLFAALVHPEAKKKLVQEIDEVIGLDRSKQGSFFYKQ